MNQFKHIYVSGIFFSPVFLFEYAEKIAYVQVIQTYSGFWLWLESMYVNH